MASKAVNRPTDSKQKEHDINQKLQLYGIWSAFSNGKVPSNKQIDVALNTVLASKALSQPSKELSDEGQSLVKDLREVIEASKTLVLVKNEGNLFQEIVWDTEHLGHVDAKKPGAPVDKETATQHGHEAVEGLKTLGTLLVTNGQFRKLLDDALILVRDIAGDTAQRTAGRVKPSEEQLANIDAPAEDNVWHEKPNLSKEQLRSQVKARYGKKESGEAAGPTDPTRVDAQGAPVAPESPTSTTTTESKREHLQHRAKEYLNEKVPKERRTQTVWRLKKMLVEIQGHSDYQRAIETLLTLAENYAGHAKTVSQQGAGSVKGARTDEHLKSAETNLRTLIERFANNTSLDDFFESLNKIYDDADKDPQLRGWFKSVNSFIRKCLREQGFVLQDTADQEWNNLYDEGRFLLRERYRGHTNRIVDEVKFLAHQFDEDPHNKALGNATQKLFNHLGQDEFGKPALKKHLIKDITGVILPAIFENTRYIPVPRIEVADPMVDVVVENLVIESDNLAPNVCEFGSDNFWRWGRKKISNKHDNKMMFHVSGVQLDLRDVSYYIKKKEGFPSITDKGLMDIFLGGEGLSFRVAMSNAHKKDSQHFVKLDKVDVNLKNLNIKLKKSKHKILFTMFKPLLFRVVKPALTKVIEQQIRQAAKDADSYAFEIHQEAQKAAEAAKQNPDPDNVKNIYNYYVDAVRAKMTEKKQRAEQVAKRDTKVQMAITHHASIFPDIKLDDGISNKATEYKELAAKGERWESPVFSIGSASESNNVPELGPVTRKPHNVAAANLRERERASEATTAPHDGLHKTYGNGTSRGNGVSTGNGVSAGNGVDGGFKREVDTAFAAQNPNINALHTTTNTSV